MRICYFRECITLSKYLNFSLAAKQLNMTQPGLSRHISSLENEIGVKLFIRDTHQVRLTRRGERFVTEIQKILDAYDFLRESLKSEGLEKITVGVPYYGVNKYLSQIMGTFKADHSNVKIDYLPAYPDEIITSLVTMQLDVAVLPRVDFLQTRDLISHVAFKEPLVLMMSKAHPLAPEAGVGIEALVNQTIITLKGNFGAALVEDLCRLLDMKGFPPPKEIRLADSIEAAALNMDTDTGVMLLPGHIKTANISEDVTFVDVLDEACCLSICLVHHSKNDKPVVDQFIRHYLSQADSTSPS